VEDSTIAIKEGAGMLTAPRPVIIPAYRLVNNEARRKIVKSCGVNSAQDLRKQPSHITSN
jgi:hypothetical protein